ncbi:hypothetical protein [Haemophilus parahaemolyticus]|uniref:hypothetical protein n=1 Tax=Haemophilus parahaemolyticus TaxID=735 RepID=UPI0028E385D7|nr:hypothetical protein [Haemophilus parahaemolyticus]
MSVSYDQLQGIDELNIITSTPEQATKVLQDFLGKINNDSLKLTKLVASVCKENPKETIITLHLEDNN